MGIDWQLNARRLTTDLEMATERIRELEEALGVTFRGAPCFGLTKSEERLVGAFLKNRFVTKRAAAAAIYIEGRDMAPSTNLLGVHISHLRRKLAPFEIRIRTVYAEGWAMEPPHQARLRAIQDAAGLAVQA
ncbi:MAG TPA: hypothetical protein VM659_28670 [Dongiaceae bacterium]|nr:hypothetical protein [Dongiaceae bacterium]